jgi:hypothetical protein
MTEAPDTQWPKCGSLAIVTYKDHVLFHRGDPLLMSPEKRQAVGWLVYECEEYVVISWDRKIEAPTLKGGDAKASGLVLLRSDITGIEKVA